MAEKESKKALTEITTNTFVYMVPVANGAKTSERNPRSLLRRNMNANAENCDAAAQTREEAMNTECAVKFEQGVRKMQLLKSKSNYTKDDLKSFMEGTTIEPFDIDNMDTCQIFQQFIDDTSNLENPLLANFVDRFHFAIMMQAYSPGEAGCHVSRQMLLSSIADLTTHLPLDFFEFIGDCMCDKLIVGTGMARLECVVKLQHALSHVITQCGCIRRIAMSALLATFIKVSGKQPPNNKADIITKTFEMAKLVDWQQLDSDKNVSDIFILLRIMAMILNTGDNRKCHDNWETGLGKEISDFFYNILCMMRLSRNLGSFEKMIERYLYMSSIISSANKVRIFYN